MLAHDFIRMGYTTKEPPYTGMYLPMMPYARAFPNVSHLAYATANGSLIHLRKESPDGTANLVEITHPPLFHLEQHLLTLNTSRNASHYASLRFQRTIPERTCALEMSWWAGNATHIDGMWHIGNFSGSPNLRYGCKMMHGPEFLGLASADYSLVELSRLLQRTVGSVSPSIDLCLVDESLRLVATSVPGLAGAWVPLAQVDHPVLRQAGRVLAPLGPLRDDRTMRIAANRTAYMLTVTPFVHANATWSIVLLIPRAEYFATSDLLGLLTVLTAALLIAVTLAFSVIFGCWVTRRLNAAAQQRASTEIELTPCPLHRDSKPLTLPPSTPPHVITPAEPLCTPERPTSPSITSPSSETTKRAHIYTLTHTVSAPNKPRGSARGPARRGVSAQRRACTHLGLDDGSRARARQWARRAIFDYVQWDSVRREVNSAYGVLQDAEDRAPLDLLLKCAAGLRAAVPCADVGCSVLYVEVAGFRTRTLGTMDTAQLIKPFEHFLNESIHIIHANRGYVAHLMAHCIVAYFGAPPCILPHHEYWAARCALQIQRMTLSVRPVRDKPPPIRMRAGIASGSLHLDPQGETQLRLTSDLVTLATRLGTLNPYLGTAVLASGRCFEVLDPAQFIGRRMATICVGNWRTRVYELVTMTEFFERASHEGIPTPRTVCVGVGVGMYVGVVLPCCGRRISLMGARGSNASRKRSIPPP
eukprot:gnl/Trimastix_PCT/2641.p1 GENE.gnl/Trimastix_PCT/2641~~gnl/Trimastix_PCT/2641.p1  ORF type:complete len:702 (-),score=90.74 gnl/Trimastix_PCT/2641:1606-3711(-)